jgi:hypothetical protein
LKDEVIDTIAEKSQGMLQAIAEYHSVAQIREALQSSPSTLTGIYEMMLRRIPPRDRKMARNAFRWLTISPDPLSTEALAEAVVLRPGSSPIIRDVERIYNPNFLLKVLGNFVVLSSDSSVRLVHFTVVDFLASLGNAASDITEDFATDVDED